MLINNRNSFITITYILMDPTSFTASPIHRIVPRLADLTLWLIASGLMIWHVHSWLF